MSPSDVSAFSVAPQRHDVNFFGFGVKKSESRRGKSLDEVGATIPREAVAWDGLHVNQRRMQRRAVEPSGPRIRAFFPSG